MRTQAVTYHAGVSAAPAAASAADGGFADALTRANGQKQAGLTMEQAARLREKHLSDRFLSPTDVMYINGELLAAGAISQKAYNDLNALFSSSTTDGTAWKGTAIHQYLDLYQSVLVPGQSGAQSATFWEVLCDKSAYSWTNEWGEMGMVSDGTLVQLGPGINLNSKGDTQLSEAEIQALRDKYMADGDLSAADARFLVGELSSLGAIDGQLAWDLIMGETFSRDFSRPREAAFFAAEREWALQSLLDYLDERRDLFRAKADCETDPDRWDTHDHWALQNQKLRDRIAAITA